MIRQFSRRGLLSRALDLSGCGRVLRTTRVWRGVLILNYHRIGDCRNSLLDRALWSATDDDFDRQLEIVAKNFDVIGLGDIENALKDPCGRYVMFTFDDGYRDNYTNAYPILKSHGVPATFFLTSGFLDKPQVPWWDEIAWMTRTSTASELDVNRWTVSPVSFGDPDRDAAIRRLLTVYKRLPNESTDEFLCFLADALQTGRCPTSIADELWMTWDMVREMKQNGMTFGGHSVTHPILANQSAQDQDWEIGECQRRLTTELGEPSVAFSYPVGGPSSFNQFTRTSLANHGYRMGFTYSGAYPSPGHRDLYAISRTAVETDVDLPLFKAVLTLPQVFA